MRVDVMLGRWSGGAGVKVRWPIRIRKGIARVNRNSHLKVERTVYAICPRNNFEMRSGTFDTFTYVGSNASREHKAKNAPGSNASRELCVSLYPPNALKDELHIVQQLHSSFT
jgi:hypothetical protein